MTAPNERTRLKRLQGQSLGFVLIRCGQLFNERSIARVNTQAGFPVLREAHTRLLPHLTDPDGVRITTLSKRLAITKQAVQQLVADLVALGVVRREDDPDDARARRVVLTEVGLTAMLHGTHVLLEVEHDLAPGFPERDARQLRGLLQRLLEALEAGDGPA